MKEQNEIIELLKNELIKHDSVHAMWLEGSLAEGDADKYSDLDIWLSVDDDKLRSIYVEVESVLEKIASIDFKLVVKPAGELGHNVYHIQGTGEFLSLDINTQKLSRTVILTENIDIYKTLFDKTNIIQTASRKLTSFDKPTELSNLLKYIDYAALSVKKNAFRGKKMESNEYYRSILINVLEYLRKKAGIPEKADFGFKHIHKDIPHEESGKLEDFYFANPVDSIEPLKSWLKSI